MTDFSNLLFGGVCVVLGLFLAWYAGGYERGEEYKTGQYVIETLVCLGLFITAVLLIVQGDYLVLFA